MAELGELRLLARQGSYMKIVLGPERLRFQSFEEWANHANDMFGRLLFRQRQDSICLDAKHRVCRIGRDFQQAKTDKAFPVICYAIRTDVE